MSILRVVLLVLVAFVLLAGAWLAGLWLGLYGEHVGPGNPTATRVPPEVVGERTRTQRDAARSLTAAAPEKEILFGDLHVHTTFSTDAFVRSLPMMGGGGAHPVADACDYARFCSALDFWSINDHAEASTPRKWDETKETIRTCNALGGDPADPDVVSFLGWEWSQVGLLPPDHYGHKNVIFRDLADDEVPARPIGAAGLATDALRGDAVRPPWYLPLADLSNRQRYYDFITFIQEIREVPLCPEGVPSPELPADCYESTATPAGLYRKLQEWGFDTIVIPHGNTWGFYSPPGITWDKQLEGDMHDPARQILVEVMSGHGNSEEYRDWRAVEGELDGENPVCPKPTETYTPSCWRAGEIIRERCQDAGLEDAECERRAVKARADHAWLGQAGHNAIPGAEVEDWLDAGQCTDCFQPSFNYRPGGSTQYALAISSFDDEGEAGEPRRFRFGFIASSDNHTARPGTGYKEKHRLATTDASGPPDETWRRRLGREPEEPVAESRRIPREEIMQFGLRALEAERQATFFMTGGLAAVHSPGRSRDAVWDALERKEVYGTSGDRILLWFNLLNAEDVEGAVPMGGETRMSRAPRFEVRAVGAFEQKPGCPDYSVRALSPERLEALCQSDCYHPSDTRHEITRIEVVRIRPQERPDEDVAMLIEDPWKVIPCEPSESGCVVQFEDPEFAAGARDSVYYVRALQEPTMAINADPLRCEYDDEGNCIEVQPCYGDYRTPRDEDCRDPVEERAWSSPIFVDWDDAAAPVEAVEPTEAADAGGNAAPDA